MSLKLCGSQWHIAWLEVRVDSTNYQYILEAVKKQELIRG